MHWIDCRNRPPLRLIFQPGYPAMNPVFSPPSNFLQVSSEESVTSTCNRTLVNTDNKRKCDFLIIILSRFGDRKEREQIRYTWLREEYQAKIPRVNRAIFMISYPKQDEATFNMLMAEQLIWNDMLLLGTTLPDNYGLLTIRVLFLLQWVTQLLCPQQRPAFLIKSDQDSYWNLKSLNYVLCEARRTKDPFHEKYLVGDLNRFAQVFRRDNDLWKTYTEEYAADIFPLYASGSPGYILTISSAQAIYKAAIGRRILWLEDVYITGVIAEQEGISRYFFFRLLCISFLSFKDNLIDLKFTSNTRRFDILKC
ncbi:unnamed protein product [Protopolystoma xenopodis]|uniref:Hexosyltransferase n=1 Tax=Protopolystoma xenopodis TaxID=117903 RepID=A0A3S5A4C2_9PLAT|nr:unnamed protein product [Protopolystoma xenopodis]